MTEAGATDAAEDVGLGRARGDELLAELASPISRLARLERALAEIASNCSQPSRLRGQRGL